MSHYEMWPSTQIVDPARVLVASIRRCEYVELRLAVCSLDIGMRVHQERLLQFQHQTLLETDTMQPHISEPVLTKWYVCRRTECMTDESRKHEFLENRSLPSIAAVRVPRQEHCSCSRELCCGA